MDRLKRVLLALVGAMPSLTFPVSLALAGSEDYTSTAKASLEKFYSGTDRALPNSAPPVAKGKKVWVIACAMAAEGCANPANAAADAGRKLGWTMTVQDGRLDPNIYNSLIRTAITAKVDGIILAAVDCGPVQNSLSQAVAAGIKVVGTVALDCSQKYVAGKPLFSAQVSYCANQTSSEEALESCYEQFLDNEYARNMADYTIAKRDGKADVIVMQENDTLEARLVGEAYQGWLNKCGDCKTHVISFSGQDLVTGRLQSIAAAALIKYRSANAVEIPYDAAGLLGVGAAVKTARAQGRDVLLVGAEGLSPAIAQIKSGTGQTFATGAPTAWWGWAAVDTLNRVFAGQPQVDQGIGVAAVDKEHNIPTETTYYDGNARSKWRENYIQLWGVR